MRRSSAGPRWVLFVTAVLAGCSIYDSSLLVDAPPVATGGTGGQSRAKGGEGGTGEGGDRGMEGGEGGTEGDAGEGGSDGGAGEGGDGGSEAAGAAGSEPTGGGSAGVGGDAGVSGKGGKGGAAGTGGAGKGGAAGVGGKGGAAGAGGLAAGSGGVAGAGGGAGTGGGNGGDAGSGGVGGSGTCSAKLVINEVSIEKGTAKSDELVELYNPTACEIVLTGWSLKYASQNLTAWPTGTIWTGSATAKIAANGYFVIGSPNYIGGGGVADEEGKLGISTPAGVGLFTTAASPDPVDSMSWGTVIAGSPATEKSTAVSPGSGKSIGRSASSIDTNDNSADFTDQMRSPGVVNP